MAMYEVFYAEKLYSSEQKLKNIRKKIEPSIKNDDDGKNNNNAISQIIKVLNSNIDENEEEVRSLIGINKGRKNMREALGMNMETPVEEAIKKFWLLGEFLDLGTGIENKN